MNPISNCMQMQSESKNHFNSVETMLDEWVHEGSCLEERAEAKRRIIDCLSRRDSCLNLSHLHLQNLPPKLFDFSILTERLEFLNLSGNQLGSLPKEIGNLQRIRKIFCRCSRLIDLPQEIGKLQQLESIDLENNCLTTLPQNIGHLNSLKRIDLSNNHLMNLPEEIGRLTALKSLDLFGNHDLKALPKSIFQLSPDTDINLIGCSLSLGVYDEIRHITGQANYLGPILQYSLPYSWFQRNCFQRNT